MVKLTQVDDDASAAAAATEATSAATSTTSEETPKTAEVEENDEDYEDTSDSDSDDDDEEEDLNEETLYERIVALREIIPPTQRSFISDAGSSIKSFASSSFLNVGNFLWIATSSALLLAIPTSLALLSEHQLVEMENEMKLQQESASVLAPGSEGAFEQPKETKA
ncbi:Tom22 protein [Saccharomycopsis crataegensis]|uniref:Tom22 protein n=1 Tax=Saccharomycopsis crataegensis TaxID=43959 RepID=A0AAV5QN05_9ASCO|nr:Tom22 protein [Saccharomycopsis crataegensis]